MCSGPSPSREVSSEQGAYSGRSWLLTGAVLGAWKPPEAADTFGHFPVPLSVAGRLVFSPPSAELFASNLVLNTDGGKGCLGVKTVPMVVVAQEDS